jgi:putative ABC transport system permease protein
MYVTEETLRDLFPDDKTWDWSMGLQLTDPEAVPQLVASAKAAMRPDAITDHTDWRDVREAAVFGIQLNFIFLGTFSILAILAMVLVITTNISTTVLAQFRQIGILKAIGFTRGQILAVYLGEYVVLSLVGGMLGLGVGQALAPLPLKSVAESMSTTYQPPITPGLLGGVLGIVALIVLSAVVGAAGRGASTNTLQAIAIGAEAPQKTNWPVHLAERLGVPVIFVLGLNDVFAKPFRSALTGLGLMLGVVGIVFGLTINQILEVYRSDPALVGIVYDAIVTAQATTDNQLRWRLQHAPGVRAFYWEEILEVKTLDGQSFRLRAVDGNLAAFPFQVPEGRFFTPGTYEAIAGRGLLTWLGLEVGDEITLQFGNRATQQETWYIVGQYMEPANAGQMLMVPQNTVRRWIKGAGPGTYYLQLDPQADPAELKQYLQPKPDTDINLTVVQQKVPDAIVYLQASMLALGVILIAIALINVFNTTLLAVQEKRRLVGILKTVGMTPAQVVTMVNVSAGFLGLLAVTGGIPAGVWLTRLALNWLSAFYGYGRLTVSLNVWYLLFLAPTMVGVSILSSLAPARWAARQSAVQAFRAE